MNYHTLSFHTNEHIHIGKPDFMLTDRNEIAEDVVDSFDHYRSVSIYQQNLQYFFIYSGQQAVGQIALHDINEERQESLVAYHIFYVHLRHRGIGTQALELLKQYVTHYTTLRKLTIITSDDNIASQQLAKKCGFVYRGTSREDPVHGVVFTWERK